MFLFVEELSKYALVWTNCQAICPAMFDERRKAWPNVNTKKRQPVLNEENITQMGKKK